MAHTIRWCVWSFYFWTVIARMDTPKYGETLRDTWTGITHKLGKPFVRLYWDRLVLYILKFKCLTLFWSIDSTISRQIPDFWQSAILKSFTLRDLEKIMNNLIWSGQLESLQLSFTLFPSPVHVVTSFALRRHLANSACSITVTSPCQVGWKFLITIYALISCFMRFTKPVIGLSKVMGSGNKISVSSRQTVPRGFAVRFQFAVSPPCAPARKLRKILLKQIASYIQAIFIWGVREYNTVLCVISSTLKGDLHLTVCFFCVNSFCWT